MCHATLADQAADSSAPVQLVPGHPGTDPPCTPVCMCIVLPLVS